MTDNIANGIEKEHIKTAVKTKLGHPNFVILDYRLEAAPERIGLLGDHDFLNVKILDQNSSESKTQSFFVKHFPKLEATAKFAEGIGAFKKEEFVYNLLGKFRDAGIDIADNCTSKCYVSFHNKYLILDNLISEDFNQLNKHVTLDYDTILVVLNSLAQFHACSLIYEEKKSFESGKEYRLIHEFEEQFEESFFNDKKDFPNAKGIEASFKCIEKEIEIFKFPEKLPSGKKFREVVREICLKIFDLVKPSKKYRNVLSHGDLWVTNFLFKPQQCKFVDFQCGRYVSPTQDVLTLIYLTTSREFRKNYMYEVIGIYYSYLEKHLKVSGYNLNKIIPFNDFMESCEQQKPFALVITAIYFPLILIRSECIQKYFDDPELNQKALFEDRSYLVFAHIDEDETYKKRLWESMEDLREYCSYR